MKGDILKIYHLIIAYNDKTEEVEYIQEELEDDSGKGPGMSEPVTFNIELGEDHQFDDETLIKLIDEFGLGEA